ncbi:hypothetical protein ACNJX9_14165 [Bradyrhizobium sp. DASA03076]|uniref:hypothetical protein n=1 Tax=Bradyrhizobium sp. BLXBL-03 TaxID=3395916 RepID=UPI003F6EE236
MLTDADIAMLCDIDQSIDFSYAHKNGDTYERTPKGEAAVIDRGAEQGVMSISRGRSDRACRRLIRPARGRREVRQLATRRAQVWTRKGGLGTFSSRPDLISCRHTADWPAGMAAPAHKAPVLHRSRFRFSQNVA